MLSRSINGLALLLLLLGTRIVPSEAQLLQTVYPSVAWSPDSAKIAVASDMGMSIYTKALQPALTMQGQGIPMNSVQWSPDGSKLLGSGTDGIVRVWNVQTGEVIDTFDVGSQMYTTAAWNPDGKQIALGSADHRLRVWDTSTKIQIATISAQDEIVTVKWSPNGKYIAIAGGHYDSNLNPSSFVQIVDTSSWGIAKTINSTLLYEPVLELSWNQSSTQLVVTSVPPFIWDISTEKAIATFEEHLGQVLSVDWNPSVNAVVSTSVSLTSMYTWNPTTGAIIKEFDVNDHIFNVAWSPDGDYVAGASIDDKVILWAATGRKLKCVQLPQQQSGPLPDFLSVQPTSC